MMTAVELSYDDSDFKRIYGGFRKIEQNDLRVETIEMRKDDLEWLERLHRMIYPFYDVPENNLLKPYIWGVPVSWNDGLPKGRVILSS